MEEGEWRGKVGMALHEPHYFSGECLDTRDNIVDNG